MAEDSDQPLPAKPSRQAGHNLLDLQSKVLLRQECVTLWEAGDRLRCE